MYILGSFLSCSYVPIPIVILWMLASLQVRGHEGHRPSNAVEGGRNGSDVLYVCRTVDLVGQLDRNGCRTVVGEAVQIQQSHFEVLVRHQRRFVKLLTLT